MFDVATMFMLVRIAAAVFLLWLFYRLVRSGIARVRGDRERAKRLRGQLIGFVIAFVLLWPFTGIRLQQSYLEWRYRSHMYEIAETLGYVAEDFLFEGSGCWDPVLTFYPLGRERCGIFLYFTTDLNVDELEPLVLQLPSPNLSESEGFTDVADVFDYMFYRTSDYSALTLDGKEMSKQDLSRVLLRYYEWSFYKEYFQRLQTIEWNELSSVSGLEFDGKPINENIILIYLPIGYVTYY